MLINIVSNISEKCVIDDLRFFNNTVAWFLRKAFEKRGIEIRLVSDSILKSKAVPDADHTIVISAAATYWIRTMPEIYKKVRNATKGKVTLYLDADMNAFLTGDYFDFIFTVVPPRPGRDPRFIYAGWGADPEYSHPEQEEMAIFLDSLMWGKYGGRYEEVYKIYEEVLASCGLKVYNPLPIYGKSERVPWLEMQAIIRKCHYYCCTQVGESGLTRIESATSGALLIVPKALSITMPRTIESLEHRIWETRDELIEILNTKTDPEAISKKALDHSWDKAAQRISEVLFGPLTIGKPYW